MRREQWIIRSLKDVFNNAIDAFSDLVIAAGARVQSNLVDLTARAGYSLIDQKPKTPHEKVSEYFIFDWEYSQTPEQSSLAASSWVRRV
jgi:polyamine oxidase